MPAVLRFCCFYLFQTCSCTESMLAVSPQQCLRLLFFNWSLSTAPPLWPAGKLPRNLRLSGVTGCATTKRAIPNSPPSSCRPRTTATPSVASVGDAQLFAKVSHSPTDWGFLPLACLCRTGLHSLGGLDGYLHFRLLSGSIWLTPLS